MENFQLFVQKHKQSAYILAAAFIAFINCCGFPFFNLNKEWPLMITALKIWAVVGGSWVSGILLAKLFCEKKFPFIAFVVVCASIIGLICRYFLEFGEASNTYNFTIPNVLFHLAGMAAITFWGWLNATGQSEKVSWASIGKRKIVAVILVLCFMCAGIYVWSIRFQVMVSSYEYRYGAGNFLSPDGQ